MIIRREGGMDATSKQRDIHIRIDAAVQDKSRCRRDAHLHASRNPGIRKGVDA